MKALFDFNTYQKYRHYIKLDKAKDREIYYLFIALDNLFKETKQSISFDEYALWVSVNLGNAYDNLLNLIKMQVESNPELLIKTLNVIKQRDIAHTIAQTALAIHEGREVEVELKELVDSFYAEDQHKEQESPFVEDSLADIYNDQIKEQGLRWRLNSLNRSVGSLRKGNFGVIFARPETGKTTFLASEVSHFTNQTNSPILWLNNEEDGRLVKFRIAQAYFGLTGKELASNLEEYTDRFNNEVNLKLYDSASIHKRQVEELCAEYKPGLILFDQLHKVKGFKSDREDLRLGEAFGWAREIAKEYAPFLAINQADGSGEGKKYLAMDNIANAKTAIQAEADLIIGIGATHDAGFEFIRHLNISKNKLTGDVDTDPKLRHSKIDVLIQPEIARYRDL